MSSRIPTTVTFSLNAFAVRGGPGGPIDGWGIAYHDGRDVRLYKEPEPAADSAWLAFVEERRLLSNLVMSHMRHATQGGISLANTQPFVRELGGRMHVFAHNGYLDRLARPATRVSSRFSPVGNTDSEAAFCVLLERLAEVWSGCSAPDFETRLAIFEHFAADMRAMGPANFLYTDGEALFAHGHRRTQAGGSLAPPGLWQLHRRCAIDRDGLAGAGIAIEGTAQPQELTLLASVPLTAEPWTPLEEGEVVSFVKGCPTVDLIPKSWPQRPTNKFREEAPV